MLKIKKFIKFVFSTNILKTLFLNFHYFSFLDAIKFPILVSYRTSLETVGGRIDIKGKTHIGMLLLGYRGLAIVDSRYERTTWHVKGKLVLGGKVSLGRGTNLVIAEKGKCVFGDNFTITGRSTIICKKNIDFGSNVLISWDVLFMDTDYHYIINNSNQIINGDSPIFVGNNVWIGCRCLILKGTKIPEGCIIAAGSTISGELGKCNAIYGSERKLLRSDISWYR